MRKKYISIYISIFIVVSLTISQFVGFIPNVYAKVAPDYDVSGENLVESILGSGLQATNIVKKGTVYPFSNGKDRFGIESGIILDTSGTIENEDIDSDLESLMDYPYGGDTSSIEFTMIATGNLLNFEYVFASQEFICSSEFNDVFGLFVSVNGSEYENIATIKRNDGEVVPVNITNLKNGLSNDEFVQIPEDGKQYSLYKGFAVSEDFYELDSLDSLTGISNVFTAKKQVNVGDTVKVKIVIADVSDDSVDSFVFIKGNSLSFNLDNNGDDQVVIEGNKIIKDIVDGKDVSEVTEELANEINEAIQNGDEIKAEMEINSVNEEDVKTDVDKIKEKIDKNSTVSGIFDVDINVLKNNAKIGTISELRDKVTVKLSKPEEAKNVPEGYKRTFKITSVHDGQVIEYETTDNGDTVSCQANLFSTYLLSYTDTIVIINPATGDNILFYESMLIVSLIGLAGAGIYLKKKRFN